MKLSQPFPVCSFPVCLSSLGSLPCSRCLASSSWSVNICDISIGGTLISQLQSEEVLATGIRAVVRCTEGGCSRAGGQPQRPQRRRRHGLGQTKVGLLATDRKEQSVRSRQQDPGYISIVAGSMCLLEQKAAGGGDIPAAHKHPHGPGPQPDEDVT